MMLWQVVAGAHTDGLAVALGVAAILALRRSAVLAGALLGAAISTKVTLALLAVGLVWAARRHPRMVAAGAVGAAVVVVPGYSWFGLRALMTTLDRGQFTSKASPWALFSRQVGHFVDSVDLRHIVAFGALFLGIAVAAWLLSRLPRLLHNADDLGLRAVPVALALTLAFVFTSPVQYPWYDAAVWPLLALMPAGALDLVVLARTCVLTVAYLPGRVVPLIPLWFDEVMGRLRGQLTPLVLAGLTVLLLLAVRHRADRQSAEAPSEDVAAGQSA